MILVKAMTPFAQIATLVSYDMESGGRGREGGREKERGRKSEVGRERLGRNATLLLYHSRVVWFSDLLCKN